MGLFVGLFMFILGYALVNQKPKAKFVDHRTPEEIEQARVRAERDKRPYYGVKEHLLIFIVYAHYARQIHRQNPCRDAILHTRLYELQQGWKCKGGDWRRDPHYGDPKLYDKIHRYVPVNEIDRDFFNYIADPSLEYGYGKEKRVQKYGPRGYYDEITPGRPFEDFYRDIPDWPFPGGLYYGCRKGTPKRYYPEGLNEEFPYEADICNRITEWYYLVMFRDEFLASGADIRGALYEERPHSQLAEIQIESAVQNLLNIGQDIVRNGDGWERWVLEQIERREAQAAAEAEVERIKREAPGEARRAMLLYGKEAAAAATAASNSSLAPHGDYHSPDWARQQLKEKYGIDYQTNEQ